MDRSIPVGDPYTYGPYTVDSKSWILWDEGVVGMAQTLGHNRS